MKFFERSVSVARSSRIGLVVFVIALAHAETANAFCHATTCDVTKEACPRDTHNCLVDGAPLYWQDGSLSLSVDSNGSTLRGISKADFEAAVSEALSAWSGATCPGGGQPALHVGASLLDDGAVGYDSSGPNTNLVIMDDQGWPYDRSALGKTLLEFGLSRGDLRDADIVLNTEDFAFSATLAAGDIDLVGVLTHETGHALGLDHSDVPGATMQPETTSGFGAADLRSLEPDDMAGICSIYPPDSGQSPDGGSTWISDGLGGAGCTIARRPSGAVSSFAVGSLFLVFLLRRSARRGARGERSRRAGRQLAARGALDGYSETPASRARSLIRRNG